MASRSVYGLYLDFLAPSWARQLSRRQARASPSSIRALSTSSQRAQDQPAAITEQPQSTRPVPPLTAEQAEYLERALRVNQAGELAATLIYAAQTPLIARSHPQLRSLMGHMAAQEEGHLKVFNGLVASRRVRPTALEPAWRVAATGLGWATAALGKEAAMACTEAVETEIGEHYNGQVRELLAWAREREARGQALGPELEALLAEIRRIRDEELEHLDHAVDHDAKQADAYPVLSTVIRAGCRGAIWLSERV